MKDAEVDLRRVFSLIRRRAPLILAVTSAFMALALVAVVALPPVYTATSLIVFDPAHKDLLDPDAQSGSSSADNARIESEVELLRSDTILLKVIAQREPQPEAPFAPGLRKRVLAAIGLGSAEQPSPAQRLGHVLAELRSAVSVQRRGLTYLIAVQARSGDPAAAADLANAVAQTYIDDQLGSKINALLSSRDVLQARLAEARHEIAASEAAFTQFLHDSTMQLTQRPEGFEVLRLTREIDELGTARAEASRLSGMVQASLADGNWDDLRSLLDSESATILSAQHHALAHQIVDTEPPLATDLQAQLLQSADAHLAGLRTYMAELDEQRTTLQDHLRAEVMQSELPADVLTGLFDLQNKASFAREQYQLLLSRSLELQNESNLQIADSRIASPALPPSTHSFPNTSIFLGFAVLLGLGAGVATSAFYEGMVGGFMSHEQLEAALRTRVAASVPRVKLPIGNDTLADLVITAPLSQFSEALRRTRMAIDQSHPHIAQGPGRVVMVTSAVPGEGKSTVALALARSYALAGRRTLLMECDLRHPSLGRELHAEPRTGLLEALQSSNGSVTLVHCLQQEPDTKLSLLLASRATGLPTNPLLASARFQRLIEEAVNSFDIVVLDTPPVEPVADALHIARLANVILLVTRWASTSQRETKRTLASLMQAKDATAPIISMLNAKDEPKARTRHEYKRYYDADYA